MAIANAIQDGKIVRIFNEKGACLHSFLCSSAPGDGLKGYTSSTVSIQIEKFVRVYDEKGKILSVVPVR